MLSIIVSSYQENYFIQFSQNVKETIGIDFQYEIIQIWNPGLMSICEAYNKGAEQAKYENLLFVHEDVLFETINWGNILIKYLKDDSIGCVGLAGSIYTPNVPFAWWDLHESSFRNVIQYIDGDLIRLYNLENDKIALSLDGVFLACRLAIFKNYRFNEDIKGFHMYDIDFSNRIAENYKNIISSKILIKHFSGGSLNRKWIEALINYRTFFKKPNYQFIDKKKEVFFYLKFLKYIDEYEFSYLSKLKLKLKYGNPKYIGYKLFFTSILKKM